MGAFFAAIGAWLLRAIELEFVKYIGAKIGTFVGYLVASWQRGKALDKAGSDYQNDQQNAGDDTNAQGDAADKLFNSTK